MPGLEILEDMSVAEVQQILVTAWVQAHMGQLNRKREQPIYSTKAHVFQIDPKTKKSWLQSTQLAIPVSYFYDNSRQTYRIISVDGSKAVINSTITPNMTFTKTSQKFGQWSDPRANTVYGLGFTTEADLLKFIEKFNEIKELSKQVVKNGGGQQVNGSDSPRVNGPSTPTPGTPNPGTPNPGTPTKAPGTPILNEAGPLERQNSGQSVMSSQSEAQLKYENDRLKIALAQSSANAKKWDVELQTLKNNNARLTTALQESTSNVEEWKKQLAAYKEESTRLKQKILEMEKGGTASGEKTEGLQRQVGDLSSRLGNLDLDNKKKEEEIQELKEKVGKLGILENEITTLKDTIQQLQGQNESLKSQVSNYEHELQILRSDQSKERQDLLGLQEQLGNKLTEMYELHDQISATLQT
ncbi:unnamed protein product [Owenia fusiformis]|uniref:WH1 domain-containing protein n=1 Tax=Owenia fusiformis TaxID=6347 RepID=A0A8S4PR93_OWEFU|nr:unnamed protein product [Owenia fusiformis]